MTLLSGSSVSTCASRRIAGVGIGLGVWLALAGVVRPAVAAPLESCASLALHPCPVPYDDSLPDPAQMLEWDPAMRVVGFRNTYRLYHGDVFRAGNRAPYPLPRATRALTAVEYPFDGERRGLTDYLARQNVVGLLVLDHGAIAYEYYGRGNTERTLWTSRSVAKSVVSVLVGIALREGRLRSLDVPVTDLVPELAHTAWDGVTLRHLIQHTSGVAWNEDYEDPASDFSQLTRCEAASRPYECVLGLLRSLKRRPGVAPGEVWSYNTGGAWLLGRALEKATGSPLARYLETRLWRRLPMEADGVWEALLPGQAEMGGHGFNATLRDWGRFGLFVARGGRLADGEPLLPDGWLEASTRWTQARGSVTADAPEGQFGYQWWLTPVPAARLGAQEANAVARRTFWAQGIFGQAMAIDREDGIVMVQWSVWPEAEKPDAIYDEQAMFFAGVVRARRGAVDVPHP